MSKSITGIIAEFNPLHNGHIALLDHARNRLRAEQIVVIMTGDFTQRGTPAMLNKYDRAMLAIKHGADLVIEMPAIAATSGAETFAMTGVSLLNATGVVSDLLFGAENAKMEYFKIAADAGSDDTMDLHKKINELVKKGESYVKARTIAMEMKNNAANTLPSNFMYQPNNILGLEYIKALKELKSDIKPSCIQRGSDHNDSRSSAGSGSSIRQAAAAGRPGDTQESIPDDVMKMIRFNSQFKTLIRSADLSLMLHSKLIAEKDFSNYLECNDDVSNKINESKDKFVEFENFCSLLKSKDIIYTRVSRVLSHILLGITKEDMVSLKVCDYAPYLRILSFSSRGERLLTDIKQNSSIPMFLSPKEGMERLTDDQRKVLEKDVHVSDMYRAIATGKSGRVFPTEFTRQFKPASKK